MTNRTGDSENLRYVFLVKKVIPIVRDVDNCCKPVWGARTGKKWAYVPPIVSIGSAGGTGRGGLHLDFWADLMDIGDYTQRVISTIKLWSGPSGLYIQVGNLHLSSSQLTFLHTQFSLSPFTA
jgi:hypothetical protein